MVGVVGVVGVVGIFKQALADSCCGVALMPTSDADTTGDATVTRADQAATHTPYLKETLATHILTL